MNGHEKILCAFSQMKKGMMNFVDLAFDFLCLSSVYPTTAATTAAYDLSPFGCWVLTSAAAFFSWSSSRSV